MDKATIVQELKKAGVWDVNKRHATWIAAFEAYKAATGGNLCQSCGASYTRLRTWLTS
jgi:hypothetical protein